MDDKTIRKKTFAGTFWKFSERIIAQGVTLIVSIIIARILNPKDYSVVSLVTIFFVFADLLISGGLNTALIQKKNADSIDYSTVLYSSTVIAIFCYIILFFAAPYIANAYHQSILIPIVRVMGLTLPISAVKSVWCAKSSSTLNFRVFFIATIIGTLISAVVGITMAYTGFGPWALVAQQMTNTTIDTICLFILVKVDIKWTFSFERFKSLFNYSWKILVSSLIGTIYTDVIPLFIGLKYKAEDLSYYTKGRSFPSTASTTITNTLSAVLFPVLSIYQESKEKILNYTRLFIRVTSFVVFPLLLGFCAVADNFVYVILTEKWAGAIYYIRVFSIVYMFNMIHIGNCETIKAIGRSDVYLVVEIAKKVCYFVVIAIFIFFTNSPEILAWAFVINTLIAMVVNGVPNVKLIGYKIGYQLWDLIPNLLSAAFMAVCVYFIGRLNINRILLLGLQVVAGMVIYIAISVITKNKSFYYILNLLKEGLSKIKKPASGDNSAVQ